MKNVFSCLLAFLCTFGPACYLPAIARPLSVGDAVPDFLIRNIVNYKAPSARLSDFKDHLLILDFMATSCGSCMYNLFRMDSLEAAYTGRLQVLPVSYESRGKLLSILQKRYAGRKIVTPFVAQDSVLKSWFPHQFVSHMVWIYKGNVVAITSAEYVNRTNIETVLSDKLLRLPVKKDLGSYNPAYPLLAANPASVAPANQPSLQYYSIVPPYLGGYAWGTGLYKDSAEGYQRLYTINETILNLYQQAFNLPYGFPNTFIAMEVADTSRLVFNGKGYRQPWMEANSHCYEATYPLQTSLAAIRAKMVTDLNTYLHLQGRMEKRWIPCKVFRAIANDSLRTAPPSNSIVEVNDLAADLNKRYTGLPFFCEIPASLNLYVEIPAQPTDLPTLQKILAAHGVYMSDEKREITMLVVSDVQP